MIPFRRTTPADDIGRYLASLGRWSARRDREDLVAEARRHLFDAIERSTRAGLPCEAAARMAIRAFGPAWRIGLRSRMFAATEVAGALSSGARAAAARLSCRAGRFLQRWTRAARRGRHPLGRRT